MSGWYSWGGLGSGSLTATESPSRPLFATLPKVPELDGSLVVDLAGGGGPFEVGQMVEYCSASAGGWIPARVVLVEGGGCYDLDCKPDVPSSKIRQLGSGNSELRAKLGVGDHVEYFAASVSKWIPAKVKGVNANGTYDLDCKPSVLLDKIRLPTGGRPLGSGPVPLADTGTFKEGEAVEYLSATQGSWIPARVVAAKPNGTFDTDVKPDVPADKIRRPKSAVPGTSASFPSAFKVGDAVEYFSATADRWILAKVLSVNADGAVDLDCKPSVTSDRIRVPEGKELWPLASTQTLGDLKELDLTPGAAVEYLSAQHGWIPAQIQQVNPNGTFRLDVKPDVPIERLRAPSRRQFAAGDSVEYFAASQGRYIPAKVLKMNPDNTYDLDCKPSVPPAKVRRPQNVEKDSDTCLSFSVGDEVEYFGQTQRRWIPAQVLRITARGTYDLDCKQDVAKSSLRRRQTADPGLSMGRLPTTIFGEAPSSSAQVEAFSEPVQLLAKKRISDPLAQWRYEACVDSFATLERYGQRPIVVAAVCGPAGSGKTYLLNAVAGRPQHSLPLLQVGGSSSSKTEGLWLWTSPSDPDDDRSPLLAVLDCEGFVGADVSSPLGQTPVDAQLMALCVLLASVVILNSRAPLDEELLAELSAASSFTDMIEDGAAEACRPALLWLLRDAKETDSGFLANSLLSSAQARKGPDGFEEESWRKARQTRQAFLKYFRQRIGFQLPSPLEQTSERLERQSWSSLRTDFKEGIQTFKSQLVSMLLETPKVVAGQNMSCLAFVNLFRQLVKALNDGRILSLRSAWERSQHTLCGSLSDELRAEAARLLQDLAAGRPLPGGAKLPLDDEALHTILRDWRRMLKSRWEERAMGEEAVRQEYWQELKQNLAREEVLVRAQSMRMADQRLQGALRAWQEWLEAEGDEGAHADQVCSQFGAAMDRMPAVPLARASRAAIQAAARRVSAARDAVTSALARQKDLQLKAIAWGEKAAHQEGAARLELEAKITELEKTKSSLEQSEKAHREIHAELEQIEEQVASAKGELQKALQTAEDLRAREHGLRTQNRALADSEASLRAELEKVRNASAEVEAERLQRARGALEAEEACGEERRRLEEELAKVKADAAAAEQQGTAEVEVLRVQLQRLRTEHQGHAQVLHSEFESERAVMRSRHDNAHEERRQLLQDVRRQLEEARAAHGSTREQHKEKLLTHERAAGLLEGTLQARGSEAQALRDRLHELEDNVRRSHVAADDQEAENQRLQAAVAEAKAQILQIVQQTEETLQAEQESFERSLQEAEDADEDSTPHSKRRPNCTCSIQ